MKEGIKKGHLSSDKPIIVTMTTQDLAELIDSVMQAVDKSQFGPLIEYGGTATNPKKIISQAAFPIFMTAFSTLLAKIDTISLIPEKESESGIATDLSDLN